MLQADSLPFELPGKPLHIVADCIFQKWSRRYMSHPTCYDVGYPSIERWNLYSRPLKLFIYFIPVLINRINSVQSLSRVRLFVTSWTAALQTSLSITNSQSLLKLMPIYSVMLILCGPLLLPPSIFPSIGVFSYESVLCIR